MKIWKKFDAKITFHRLFLYWIIYLFVGILLMLVITPLHPSFTESHNEINENFCNPINIVFVAMAFLVETILFMFLPWKIFGKRGLIVGLIIWSILHLIGGSLPIFIYISVMAVFYWKCFEIEKIKEVFFFHFLINLPSILSCL